MTTNEIIAEVFYCLIGIIFVLVGVKALRDGGMGHRVQLGPQAFDVGVHRAVVAKIVVPPKAVQQVVTRKHFVLVGGKGP